MPLVNRWNGYYAPEYVSKNLTEADATWSKPVVGYGVVALDRQWALRKGLSPSRPWTLDVSKNLYVLQSYHAIHCVVRKLRTVIPATKTDDSSSPIASICDT